MSLFAKTIRNASDNVPLCAFCLSTTVKGSSQRLSNCLEGPINQERHVPI